MRSLVIFSDGRTARYGGPPSTDEARDAREALGYTPVRIEAPGMPWSMWAAEKSLDPADPKWLRNLPASLLPAQYGGRATLLFGPVVLTPGGLDAVASPSAWDYAEGLVEDITRAIHGFPLIRSHRAEWPNAIRLAAAVLSERPKRATLHGIEG
jgi:hypothetical protein